VLAGCGWWIGSMAPFHFGSSFATLAVGGCLLVAGAATSHSVAGSRYALGGDMQPASSVGLGATRGPALPSRRSWGFASWSMAGGFALFVELWELFHSPRSLYPTLSSLANEVIGPGHRLARTVAFVCWGVGCLAVASLGRDRR